MTFLLSTFLIVNCQPKETQQHKQQEFLKQYVELLVLQQFLANPPQFEASACTNYMQPLNVAYPFSWPALHADTNQYTTVIIGDSTMAISSVYPGFLGTGTQSVAVAGNTLCDMITQLPAINTTAPSVIIVATTGGNDLLRQNVSDSQIINTGTLIIQRLHQKYPNAKLVMIAIHPTQVAYANAHKAAINTGIDTALQNEYPVSSRCFYNPLPLFGVAEGQASHTSDMANNGADSIHYNQAMSFNIKSAVQTNCGITF